VTLRHSRTAPQRLMYSGVAVLGPPTTLPLPSTQPSDSELFKMLKALQEEAEARWKKVEAQREQDAERYEVQRKMDAERYEAERKKDVKQYEAQRKKDAEQYEAERKKDAEQNEAERKKDAERHEAQRKQDAERYEAERKHDQAYNKERIHKQDAVIKELESEIKRLKQDVRVGELERKQNDEATQRYIACLADDAEATRDFLELGVRFSLLSPFLPLTPCNLG